MATFNLKGKTVTIPNGYSQEDTIKTYRHKRHKHLPFTFTSEDTYKKYAIESGIFNRYDFFKNIDKLIYHIEFSNELILEKILTEDFHFTIPDYIVNDSNYNIVIDTITADLLPDVSSTQENDLVFHKILINTIKKYNLSKERFIVLGYYYNINSLEFTYIPIHYLFYSKYSYDPNILEDKIKQIESHTKRQFKILCLNNKPREHRIDLFNYAFQNDLLKSNHHTFASTVEKLRHYTTKTYPFEYLLPFNTDLTLQENNWSGAFERYQTLAINSYVDFSTETRFIENGPIILTEKASQAIKNVKPFVYCATPGSLQLLKDKGFKTFDKWWSEEYDSITDNEERMNELCRLYKELTEYSDEQWVDIIYDMKDVLIHNFNTFKLHLEQDTILDNINNHFENNQIDK